MAKGVSVPLFTADGQYVCNGNVRQTPSSKKQMYANEIKSGKSVMTGESLSADQIRYRQGYLDGAAQQSYDAGVRQAKKDVFRKRSKKNVSRRKY